ncbi:LysR family transcriptional regulator [Endozoicomonas sp.]|uniref:LysR family transcriptional regulator n=1 Tax=Endozoicomonas sp. TaxID=1892382 RepID=UPI003AF82186
MKIDDLALFVRVAEELSFTEAANILDLPQSTVSRKIKHMEENLQARLFERTGRHIFLTPQGSQFYKNSKKIVDEYQLAKSSIDDFQKEPAGELTLYMLPFFAELLTKEFFPLYLTAFPKVNIVNKILSYDQLDQVQDADLIFYPLPPRNTNMVAKRVLTCSRRFYASPDYLKRHGNPEHPRDLADMHCLRFDNKESDVDKWFYFEEDNVEQVTVKGPFTCESLNLTIELARKGMGVCFVPQFMVNPLVRSQELVCLFEGRYSYEQPYYVIYHSNSYMPNKTRAFLDMFSQYMEQSNNVFNC